MQHDLDLADNNGAAFLADLNDAIESIATRFSGSTAPPTTFAHMVWADTANFVLKRRNASNTGWVVEGSLASATLSVRSSNTVLGPADFATTILASSTFTQTLTAAATLASGWRVDYVNAGSGNITLDAAGSELIGGRPTLVLRPGDAVTLICDGTGFFALWQQSRATGQVSVKLFGAVGDGIADDTAAIQAAINAAIPLGAEVFLADGAYKLTAPLNITAPVRFLGVGAFPYVGAIGTRGRGSWLYFAHTGIGCEVKSTGSLIMGGITFEKIGTFRDQPTPAPGWAPTAHDFDFSIDNADVTFNDVMLLNPTKGIKLRNGNAGRLRINGLRGQPLQVGLDIDVCYDLPMFVNVHFWPFWQDNAHVHTYTLANLIGMLFGRVDNPQLVNIFTIFAHAGLKIVRTAAGNTSHIVATNVDWDRGVFGLWVDSTVTQITNSKFTNVTYLAEVGQTESIGFAIFGSDCKFQFENISSTWSDKNALRVEGTGNHISIGGNTELYRYNKGGLGFPAVEVYSGNTVQFAQIPLVADGGGAPTYGGGGTIYADDYWQSYTPTITTGSGTIATLGTLDFRYKRRGSLVDVMIDIPITTNGTGAGDIRFTLPFTAAYFATGSGREAAISGTALTINALPGSNLATIVTYDNTYPGGTGYRPVGTLSYGV